MTETFKILGQAAPGATTEADLYAVPAATVAIISTLIICNRGAAVATFRASVSAAGGATANKDYVYYDVTLAPNDTFAATFGITLAATDKIRVYASTADLSFAVFGVERS